MVSCERSRCQISTHLLPLETVNKESDTTPQSGIMNCVFHIKQRWPSSLHSWLFFTAWGKTIFMPIKLCSSKVNLYIFWSGLFVLIRLWQQTKKPSICRHHCGQLHLSQYSEIEGEAPNPSNHISIILRAFPSPRRGAGSSLLMELVLCAQDQSRIMNSSLNNSYWGKLICFGVWRMRGVLSPASLFSLNDWCKSWNINGGHGFQSHLL